MDGVIRIDQVETQAEKAQIANLLYEEDSQFVPVTPLATLNHSTTFLKATVDRENAIRAASSYDTWLVGCDEAMRTNCDVYELASSIVRKPIGGFKPPSKALHHIFTFARLVNIVAMYLSSEASGMKVSVIAAIAAGNKQSLDNMKSIGMCEIAAWPRWLDYEHRAWFPKLADEPRAAEQEATYLWFPPTAIRDFLNDVKPYVTGQKLLERKKLGEPEVTETYRVQLDQLLAYQDLVGYFDGSIEKAIEGIPYADVFIEPPALARLDKDYESQPDSEVVF
jgi:hypothetical protein